MRALLLPALLLAGCGRDPALRSGDTVRGSLTQHDERTGDGRVADAYPLHIEAGEAVLVVATSDDVVPFIVVAEGAESLGYAEGARAGRGACVSFHPARSVEGRVVVSNSDGLEFGSYVVSVRPFSEQVASDNLCSLGLIDGEPSVAP